MHSPDDSRRAEARFRIAGVLAERGVREAVPLLVSRIVGFAPFASQRRALGDFMLSRFVEPQFWTYRHRADRTATQCTVDNARADS